MIDRNNLTDEQKELIIQVAAELIEECNYMEDAVFGIGYNVITDECIRNTIEKIYPEINMHII